MLKVAGSGAAGAGTVTLINTGTGLTGGPISTTGTISLANTTVTQGTYGNATAVSQIVIDAQGRINSASNVVISIPSGQVTGLGTMATQNANAVAITGGTFANANITSVVATFPNSYLTNSSATLGNTAVTLGSTVISVGNLTVNNETINGLTAAIATKTGNYSLTSVDCTILGNAATGNISITLPTAVGTSGRLYTVKKVDSTANVVTVATTSAQTIDGQASRLLTLQYDAVQVQSDNANWVIISSVPGRNGVAGAF